MNLQLGFLLIALAICSGVESNRRNSARNHTAKDSESTADAASTTEAPHNRFVFNETQYVFFTESKVSNYDPTRSMCR